MRRLSWRTVCRLATIQWTLHSVRAAIEHVGVDLRRLEIAMAKQLLDRANVVAGLEQMGGKAVAQRVGRDRLGQAGLLRCRAHGLLDHAFVQVKAIERAHVALWIFGQSRRGKDKLPSPFLFGIGILRSQRIGQRRPTVSLGKIALMERFGDLNLGFQFRDSALRQHRDAVFVAFAGPPKIELSEWLTTFAEEDPSACPFCGVGCMRTEGQFAGLERLPIFLLMLLSLSVWRKAPT